eukprot:5688856-Karenia_brevis.AAC.1
MLGLCWPSWGQVGASLSQDIAEFVDFVECDRNLKKWQDLTAKIGKHRSQKGKRPSGIRQGGRDRPPRTQEFA